MTEHGHHGPHEVEEDLRHDLAFERATLDESIAHDYSTADTGIVPLDKRRPMWHFAGLWTTFVAGFSYMFLGFEIHDGGHSLATTAAITLIGYGFYVAYAMTGSYLGSRTGQTHALLTRSIFGRVGSWIVSAFILVAPLGWVGYQANLLAVLWDGFYSWGNIFTLTLLLAGIMILNNLLGFTGISVFARYLVTPILILWCIYMVLKAVITDHSKLGGTAAVVLTSVLGRRRRRDRLLDVGERARLLALRQAQLQLAAADVPLRRALVHALRDGGLDDGRDLRDDGHREGLSLHGALFAVRSLRARLDHRNGQPVRDQRRQLLRIGQCRPEPDRQLEALAASAHLPGGRGRRRDRSGSRQLPLPQRVVQSGELPRRERPVRDGDHGRRPFPAPAHVPDLAAAHPCAAMGGDRADQLARHIALLGAVFFGVTGTASWPHGWLEATAPNPGALCRSRPGRSRGRSTSASWRRCSLARRGTGPQRARLR